MSKFERILTVPQMIFCEQQSDRLGVTLRQLMDNAGEELGRQILGECVRTGKKNVLILVGKGNNGGDGLVAANFLFDSGVIPTVMLCCGEPATELSKAAFEKLHRGIEVTGCDTRLIAGADIIVDCIFGTGFKGEVRENMHSLFDAVNESSAFKLACDIPSGADANSGQVSGHTVRADMTVTMHAKKLGMVLSPARYYCGEVRVCDIGIPDFSDMADGGELAQVINKPDDREYFKALLPRRLPWGHKGSFGKLVCVCGSESYIRAAGISAMAALRTGVGLVELCTPEKVIQALSSRMPECTYQKMAADNEGFMTADNADKILSRLEGADALLLGCGLGHTDGTEKLVAQLVESSPVPVILDADGINSLAANIDVLLKKRSAVILTPHPGELARLCGVTVGEILADRQAHAYGLAKKYGVTVVSKSAETLVCSGDECFVMSFGNTALSKGGSGDMLAGITASLMAQQPEKPENAAQLGCYIMGGTAEMLSADRSQRGILAQDIIRALPFFLGKLESS